MSFPRYPAYKDSGVEWLGEVPEHWRTSKLGFEAWVRARLGWKGLKAEEYVDDGFVLLSTPNIKGNEVDFENVNFITQERYEESPEIRLKEGDVLLAKDGSTLGIANVIRSLPRPATVNSSIAVITSKESLKSVFLYHLLTGSGIQQLIQQKKGGMGVPHLFQADLVKFSIPLPPIAEQLALATFLDQETAKIDALIAEQQRLIELLQEKRQAVISHAVTKGLNPDARMKDSGVEWLGEVPEHWVVCNFQRFVQIAEGQVDPKQSPFTDMPLIAPNHIQSGTGHLLDLETAAQQGAESGKYICNEGDVIYSKIRPSLRKACIAPCACLTSADMYPLRAHGRLSSEFLFRFLLSEPFSALAIVESERVAMPKINRDSLKSVALAIPPMSEQEDICQFIRVRSTTFDALIVEAQEAIVLLSERRSALISAAVTGQIDVRGLVPAEAVA